MARLVLPGFEEKDISARQVKGREETREWVNLPRCEAQLFLFGYPAGQTVADHAHSETRVTFVRSGRARFTMAGETELISTGDLITIPPGVVHRFEALGEEPFRIAELVVPAPCK